MRIREQTIIDRPVAVVWPFVATAESFCAWNDKITHMEATGPFRLGQRFATHYALHGPPTQFMTEVVALEEGRLLELRHASPFGQGVRVEMETIERVTLEDAGGRTVVTRDIDVRNHGLPWWARPLVWFVTRFGRPTGEDRLKKMCEGADLSAAVRTPDGPG